MVPHDTCIALFFAGCIFEPSKGCPCVVLRAHEGREVYLVSRFGTPTAAAYKNISLTANTTYRYRVRAVDTAGNVSGYSSIVTKATAASIDNPGEYIIFP